MNVRLGSEAMKDLMGDEEKTGVPSSVLLAFAPIHRLALGVATGVVSGGSVFLMTAALVLKGGVRVGPTLSLLGQYFFGYTVTLPGALVGLLWGFAVGFMLGWGFAVVHNVLVWGWLTMVRSRAEMEQYGDFLDHM